MIYHYCVIVEMFCIGLYARHTFRKVEPSVVEEVEEFVSVRRIEKSVQTDSVQTVYHTLSEDTWPGCRPVSTSNDSGDSLCRIEHAPLDGFPFPQARGQQLKPDLTEPRSAENLGAELTRITVRADINYQGCKDVTVV